MSFFMGVMVEWTPVDSAEDGDMSEYDAHAGGLNAVQPPTDDRGTPDTAFHGDWVVDTGEYSGEGSSTSGHTEKGDGFFDYYPSRGDDPFGVYCNSNDAHDYYFHWAIPDGHSNAFPTGYSARVQRETNDFELWFEDPPEGVHDTLATSAFTATGWDDPANWWRIDVDFQSTITCTLTNHDGTEVASVSATHTTNDGGRDTGGWGHAHESHTGSSSYSSVYIDPSLLRT